MVLYLLVGALGGCVIGYVGSKTCDIIFKGSSYVPSQNSLMTFGILVGAIIGFGFGVAKLTDGTHSLATDL